MIGYADDMNESLNEIAKQMVQKGKGLLAADESLGTAKKRLVAVGVEDSAENRRRYREVFFDGGRYRKISIRCDFV